MQQSASPQKFPHTGRVSGALDSATERTAVATEDLAVWTARDVVIDGLTGIFTFGAAVFAFFAYRQTKRQAIAAEAQTEIAKDELELSRRAMLSQMRSSALSLRPNLVPKRADVNLGAVHPLAKVIFEFEPRGALDPFEVRGAASVAFRVPGEDEWTIAPRQLSVSDLQPLRHFPANENAKIGFDLEYPEQALLDRGDTYFEFRATLLLQWKDALNWTISETWEADGRLLAKKAGSASVSKEQVSDAPPD